jgi:nuclear transport factor 2 (NTF2) superfamily protein
MKTARLPNSHQGWAMNSNRLKVALATLFCLAFSAASSRAQTPSNRDADTTAIKQTVATFQDAWNSHDAHAVAMRYIEDGDFSSIKAEDSHGRKELEEHYTTIFSTFLKNAHTTDTGPSFRGHRLAGE